GGLTGATVTVNPTVTTEYTVVATNTTTGCSSLPSTVMVNVLDLPATPVAHPSAQCGEGVPTAFVTGTGGTFLWYDAPTGGNLVQTGGASYTDPVSETTTWYV